MVELLTRGLPRLREAWDSYTALQAVRHLFSFYANVAVLPC